ncbi:hypothetical protein PFISCL1PPCAC_14311, partial [Pristionchus fissidentatus]
RCFATVLFNMSIIELITALSSLFVFNRIMSTDEHMLTMFAGPCHLTESSSLCFSIYAIRLHGHAHHCALLAFSFCYRYYVIRNSEPSSRTVFLWLTIIYVPTVIVYV